jgi:hypothetical protein
MSKNSFNRLIARKHAELAQGLRHSGYGMYDCTSQTEGVRSKYGKHAVRVLL